MNYRDRIGSEYNDLTIVRLLNGYLVKTGALSGEHRRVSSKEEVIALIPNAKNLVGKVLYVGFEDAQDSEGMALLREEKHEFEFYRKKILQERKIKHGRARYTN